MCSKLNWHVQMKVADRGMNNLDEEFFVTLEAGSKDEVKLSPGTTNDFE